MAFHHSSRDIDIEANSLFATCTDCAGNEQLSELNLDEYLGNADGSFDWSGVNFSQSARDLRVEIRGESVWLVGQLRKRDGFWKNAQTDLTHRIVNTNGQLKFVGDEMNQESHEYGRGFLGEERDFLSAAISETISDLRELFTGSSLFDTPAPRPPRRSRTSSSAPREAPPAPRESSPPHGNNTDPSAFVNLRDSTTATSTSTSNIQTTPPAETKKEAPPAYEEPLQNLNSEQREALEHEDMVMQQIKEFLLGGTNRTVTSSKTESGGRKFVLQEVTSGTSKATERTLLIEDRTLFDQDDYRRDSISEASDLGKYQARCMTPSVIDGEEEYDFLN